MRDERAAERKNKTATLPSMVRDAPDATQAPPAAVGFDSGFAAPAPVVAWQPEALKPLTDQLIAACEDARVDKFRALATEARFPINVVNKIAKDAEYPAIGKKSVELGLPRVAAKWLTKAGVSAEWEAEVVLGQGMLLIYLDGQRRMAALEKLIEEEKLKRQSKQAP